MKAALLAAGLFVSAAAYADDQAVQAPVLGLHIIRATITKEISPGQEATASAKISSFPSALKVEAGQIYETNVLTPAFKVEGNMVYYTFSLVRSTWSEDGYAQFAQELTISLAMDKSDTTESIDLIQELNSIFAGSIAFESVPTMTIPKRFSIKPRPARPARPCLKFKPGSSQSTYFVTECP